MALTRALGLALTRALWLALPARLCGMGLRRAEVIAPAAFAGMLHSVLPRLAGIFPMLAHLLAPHAGASTAAAQRRPSGSLVGRAGEVSGSAASSNTTAQASCTMVAAAAIPAVG